MSTIVLDPITRIEGHLKVSVTTDSNNNVIEAKSTGNLYRGFENLLLNRDPRDAAVITQRICGVCPTPHAMASVLAVESAAGFTPSMQAILLRNLINGCNFISSNFLHFYHLTALDYVTGPGMSPWKPTYNIDYRLSPSNNQAVLNNYKTALTMRRKSHEMQVLLSGVFPQVANMVPGGVTLRVQQSDIDSFLKYLNEIQSFTLNVYQHDLNLIAQAYSDYYQIGTGYGNLISFGVFETDALGNKLYPAGEYSNGIINNIDQSQIKEYTNSSWYSSGTGLNPSVGETVPQYAKSGAYSWLKSPRYNDKPYEAGALARVWMSGDYRRGISVIDRHAARYIETVKIIANMKTWLSQLTVNADAFTSVNPSSGEGIGLTEAPRGALGHWISIANSKIARYQVITPTCWNSSPSDDLGQAGPIEKALIGVKVADINQPIELLRIIHSFDPCIACAVHVMNPKGVELNKFIVPLGI